MPSLTRTLLTAAFAVTCTASALGQDILYGDFDGTTVNYDNVREDAQGLFGAPTISGDSLSFTPLEFLAQSQDGGISFTDGTLAFNVESINGDGIQTLTLEESGAYALLGDGTATTRVEVGVVFSVNVLEVDGVAFGGSADGSSQIAQGFSIFNADLVTSPGLAQAWQSEAVLDIADLALTELGVTGQITRASVVLDNQLLAISEDGSFSFVDKKTVDGVVVTVPEPASIALLALGGVAVLGRRRSA